MATIAEQIDKLETERFYIEVKDKWDKKDRKRMNEIDDKISYLREKQFNEGAK